MWKWLRKRTIPGTALPLKVKVPGQIIEIGADGIIKGNFSSFSAATFCENVDASLNKDVHSILLWLILMEWKRQREAEHTKPFLELIKAMKGLK